MRRVARGDIIGMVVRQIGIAAHLGIAAVAIGAAQPHRRGQVHGRRVGLHMAGVAAFGLGLHFRHRLPLRRGRSDDAAVITLDRLFLVRRLSVAREQDNAKHQRRQQQRKVTGEKMASFQHQ